MFHGADYSRNAGMVKVLVATYVFGGRSAALAGEWAICDIILRMAGTEDSEVKPGVSLEQGLERCARFGVKPGLEAIRAVCAAMGDPQDSLRVVHVAGTNGKGAVCALIDSALRAAGFRTGRYTSPHLVSLNERFFLDGSPVPESMLDSAFLRLPQPSTAREDARPPNPQRLAGTLALPPLNGSRGRLPSHPSMAREDACLPNAQRSTAREDARPPNPQPSLTYFELLTATAFALYGKAKVDYLVLETGLGGRLDATNIVRKPEVCVITRIGLDHCDWLGHTIAEIAAEKGGIIKPDVPVVLGAMPDEARQVLERIAAERHAPCTYAPESVDECPGPLNPSSNPQTLKHSNTSVPFVNLALGGKFNRENAVTALAALKVLGIGREAIERGFSSVVWPGRFQHVAYRGKRFLVDGAHNPPAMRALADSLKSEAGDRKSEGGVPWRHVICGFCGDKDVPANLEILREVADVGIAVPIRNPRSLPPERTAELMRKAGFADVRACMSVREALDAAPDGTVVCGSLFLAGEALAAMGAPGFGGRFAPNETFAN